MNTGMNSPRKGVEALLTPGEALDAIDALKVLEGELIYGIRSGKEDYANLMLHKAARTREVLRKHIAQGG